MINIPEKIKKVTLIGGAFLKIIYCFTTLILVNNSNFKIFIALILAANLGSLIFHFTRILSLNNLLKSAMIIDGIALFVQLSSFFVYKELFFLPIIFVAIYDGFNILYLQSKTIQKILFLLLFIFFLTSVYLTNPPYIAIIMFAVLSILLVWYNSSEDFLYRSYHKVLEKRQKTIIDQQGEAIIILSNVAEWRSKKVEYHNARIGKLAELMALKLGLDPDFVDCIKTSSSMHDIGKTGIPDSVLLKSEKLNDAEKRIMEDHTILGHQILSTGNSPFTKMGAIISLTHHERWDGLGYPYQLKSIEIPVEGRIVAVVDVLDALRSKKIYRKRWSYSRIKSYFQNQRGIQFDPGMVDILLNNFKEFTSIIDSLE